MNQHEILKPLLGPGYEASGTLASPPATRWRTTPLAFFGREANRLRARRRRGVELVKWAAPPGRRPRWPAVRQSVQGGAMWVEFPEESPIQVVRRTTTFQATDPLMVGSGGGIRQRGTWRGRPVLLRLGALGTPGDPTRHYQALERLSLHEIPEALATEVVEGVRWTLEGFVQGRSTNQISPAQANSLVAFLSSLPSGGESVDVVDAAAGELSAFQVDTNALAKRIMEGLSGLPSVVAHGDFWSGNLLFEDGRLAAVIDWDSWHERGLPGIDLLHLRAEALRRQHGMSYGDLVRESFWHEASASQLVADHVERIGATFDEGFGDLLGAAWWMTAAAGAMRRTPSLSQNPVWMLRNVHGPIEVLSRSFT